MKIAVTTDNHWGYSKRGDKANEELFVALQKKEPDAIIQSGDFSSHLFEQKNEFWGMVRKYFPDIPIFAVMGNHDWWHHFDSKVQIYSQTDMLNATDRIFTKHKVTHLTPAGAMLRDDIFINGFDGWYHNCQGTNDPMKIPGYDNLWMTLRANRGMADCAKEAMGIEAKTKILVTHFGFLKEERDNDWKSGRSGLYFGGNPMFEELIIEYNLFIYGHSHSPFNKLHFNGRTHCMNVGSDYENPRMNIVVVPNE